MAVSLFTIKECHVVASECLESQTILTDQLQFKIKLTWHCVSIECYLH